MYWRTDARTSCPVLQRVHHALYSRPENGIQWLVSTRHICILRRISFQVAKVSFLAVGGSPGERPFVSDGRSRPFLRVSRRSETSVVWICSLQTSIQTDRRKRGLAYSSPSKICYAYRAVISDCKRLLFTFRPCTVCSCIERDLFYCMKRDSFTRS